ncbi:hypothetical protein [Nocardioides exalbidus]|uniref:hypothetical protein n=1 Tax=Nocardioides exalbidus TaxID=402596 RepID=UPI00111546A9|nr:hypothetical protein [Nocardioides exalbidus]
MHPTELLSLIRDQIAEMQALSDDNFADALRLADSVAAAFTALDEGLMAGATLPPEWSTRDAIAHDPKGS